MEKAIKILREKTDAIKVISNDVGFKDTAYFCRRFKMMFGVQVSVPFASSCWRCANYNS